MTKSELKMQKRQKPLKGWLSAVSTELNNILLEFPETMFLTIDKSSTRENDNFNLWSVCIGFHSMRLGTTRCIATIPVNCGLPEIHNVGIQLREEVSKTAKKYGN